MKFEALAIVNGFNPCFNGYSTLTGCRMLNSYFKEVNGFNPCFNGYSTLM